MGTATAARTGKRSHAVVASLVAFAAVASAAGVAFSFAESRVACAGRRPRVQMQAQLERMRGSAENNFLDKVFVKGVDILMGALPLTQTEKDAYQLYRDGLAAQTAGDYSIALRAYAEALKLEEDPIDRSYIFYNLGIIFASNGEYVKAVKYYHIALDQNKGLYQAFNNVAVVYHDQAARAEAKGAKDKAAVLYEKAATYWNQALQLAPTNYMQAQNWLKETGRASALVEQSKASFW
eukprot:TRINITY_DN29487_c0_g1_i1.p1 TRINITY_DN29487_c0_g1~~TRINITY_DN29487_c0_g1_i1.p1  ORF type:complete len:237 (+),score=50.97 TRINITY_DN29487_c0_g1_i1:48-758(+)